MNRKVYLKLKIIYKWDFFKHAVNFFEDFWYKKFMDFLLLPNIQVSTQM